MTLLFSLLGTALIFVALRDIFDTLFHPSGKGMLSRALPRFLWRGIRRIGHRYPLAQELCGPVTLLAVIASWTALLGLGWAFVFWPHLARRFLRPTLATTFIPHPDWETRATRGLGPRTLRNAQGG